MSFVALAVDLGYMYVTKNELQNVADGAALGATRKLGTIYEGMSYEDQQGYVCAGSDADAIKAVAQEVASKNAAAKQTMSVRVEDVFIGQWDGDNFTETNIQPDAVRVIARRDALLNGPVSTFFAKIMGHDSVSIDADAIAALTGQSTTGKGELELPIGISRWFFDKAANPDDWCDDDIKFYPTNDPDSCAGWTSWEYGSNDATLRKILEEDPNYENQGTDTGDLVNFTGGTLSNPTFDDLLTLFQQKGCDVDANWNWLPNGDEKDCWQQAPEGDERAVPLYDEATGDRLLYPDGITPRNRHRWMTGVVIYDSDDCSNPNQSLNVVGFAEVDLRDVLNAPDKLVRGKLKCNYVGPDAARGGGGNYGKKGSIPGLVE